MNTLRNSVQLIGNLGKDIELKSFDNGTKLAKFSLATNEFYKNSKGEKVQETQWHNIVAWGKTAEFMDKSLSKGSEVAIKGKLTHRSYDDKNGVTKYISEIVAQEFMKITREEATPF